MRSRAVHWVGIAAALGVSGAAHGEQPPVTQPGAPQQSAPVAAQEVVTSAWAVLPESSLQQLQGGAPGAVPVATLLVQSVDGNSVGDGVSTGGVTLGAAAISGVQGIVVSTFNTGNNAAIQTNLRVDIRLE